ncbi:MAG: MoaD/ThiS family protein [Caldilineaceae bacterium]
MALTVNVRFSAALAQTAGTPRLQMSLAEGSTVGDLLDQLAVAQPHLAGRLSNLVVAAGGHHVGRDEPLQDGQEIVLVMPAAGGAHTQPTLPAIPFTGGSAW